MTPKRVIILGSTGSVGENTLDVIKQYPDRFHVVGLVAHRNVSKLAEQARAVSAEWAVAADDAALPALRDALSGFSTHVAAGFQAVLELVAQPCDMVVAAIVGMAGLAPTLAALKPGRTIALANKECLVAAGELFMREVDEQGVHLIPLDSEHNALAQLLENKSSHDYQKLVLTASGGPFRTLSLKELQYVTVEDALRHPTWRMGNKISIDSATLMNKALELIEASFLFNCPENKLDAVIHPQSVIHGFVTYHDHSVHACMSAPDMRIPISYALGWPDRLANHANELDWTQNLTFEPIDPNRFPAITIARSALQSGGSQLTILNAANEVAVQWFLEGKIRFVDILSWVEQALTFVQPVASLSTVNDVMVLDRACRTYLYNQFGNN